MSAVTAAAADDAETFIHAYSDPTRHLMFPGPVIAIIESCGVERRTPKISFAHQAANRTKSYKL